MGEVGESRRGGGTAPRPAFLKVPLCASEERLGGCPPHQPQSRQHSAQSPCGREGVGPGRRWGEPWVRGRMQAREVRVGQSDITGPPCWVGPLSHGDAAALVLKGMGTQVAGTALPGLSPYEKWPWTRSRAAGAGDTAAGL